MHIFLRILLPACILLLSTGCVESNLPKTLPDDFIGHRWVESHGVCADTYFYRNGIIEARCDKKKNTLVDYSQYKIIHQAGPNDFYIAEANSSSDPFDRKNLQERFFYRYKRIWVESKNFPEIHLLKEEYFAERPTEQEWIEFTPEQHWQKLQSTMKEIPDLVSSRGRHQRMD